MRTALAVGLTGLTLCLAVPARADDPPAAEKGWAYSTPKRPALPAIRGRDWPCNPIDTFILARLEEKGLTPAPEADRLTLLRRVTFDLTGLPPTPEEIDAFLPDGSADAYGRAVDRLLASPRFGERLATYWLDLVRYAESDGFKADDVRPTAWRYRDYVIRAFNEDRPYDRFVREQLAGDELYPGDPDALVATAFNRHFPDEYNARNLELRRQEILNDVTDTTAQVFLGLTVGCARCHDHKYDPIAQVDYYRLQAFFAALSPRDDLPLARREEVNRHREGMKVWRERTAALRQQLSALEKPHRDRIVERNKSKFSPDFQRCFDTPPARRSPYEQQIADLLAKQLVVPTQEMAKAMKPEVRKDWEALGKKLAAFDSLKPAPLAETMGVTDIGPTAPATYLLKRGNYRVRGREVAPGFLSALDDAKSPALSFPATDGTTGRRAALALWLTRADHPLTARVMVNRLWQHHFGRGIVGTPSDFGELGHPPSHPELLDWLAREFVESGWSLKHVHRLMVTSAAYRQSSRFDPAAAKADPRNKLLWRANRRRLEGEALRDATLTVAGTLYLKAGGPSVFPELPEEMGAQRGWPVTADAAQRNRRSVYVFVKRNLRYPLFSAFDAPDTNEPCARRHVSTSAPQALMLLNGKMTLDAAQAFAGRVLRDTSGTPEAAVERAYRLALGRRPDAEERRLALDFLRREAPLVRERLTARRPVALASGAPAGADPAFGGAVVELCHVLLNLNEFAYLD